VLGEDNVRGRKYLIDHALLHAGKEGVDVPCLDRLLELPDNSLLGGHAGVKRHG
jgi:hypothetical protein